MLAGELLRWFPTNLPICQRQRAVNLQTAVLDSWRGMHDVGLYFLTVW